MLERIDDELERLVERLTERPDDFNDFEAEIQKVYDATCYPHRETPRIEDGKFVYRNVTVDWPAEHVSWRWPPSSYEELTRLIERRGNVRVLGECWGMSRAAHPSPEGGMLLSGDPNGLGGPRVMAGSAPDRVRCILGATWNEVHDFLEPTSMRAPNQPGFSGLTVAGTLGMGGHGSSLHLGALESMVTQIELACLRTPEAGPIVFRRGDRDFDFAVTHLGRLGPVVAIELQAQPAFQIAERRELRILGAGGRPWQEDLRELIVEAVELQGDSDMHSAEIWLAPYAEDGEITTVLGTRRLTDEPPSADAMRPSVLRCEALQLLGQLLSIAVVSLRPRWIRGILRSVVRRTQCKEVVLSAREGLDFGAPNSNRMTAIEAAFDLSSAANTVSGVVETIDMLERIGVEDDLYLFSPLGIRFVGRGAAAGYSPQAGRAQTMHLEIPTFGDARFHGEALLRPLQERLATKYDARPHWGQRIFLQPEQLRALWPESTRVGMASLARELDPEGWFHNPWIDRVLELG